MGLARLQVLVAAVAFGTTGTAQALGPEGTNPLAVGAVRIAVGAAILLAVAALARRAVARARGGDASPRPGAGLRPRGRRERGALAAAAAGVALYQVTFFAAVLDTGVAVGTVVAIGSGPAFAGALGRLVAGEPLTGRWAVATALATAGVVVLVLAGAEAEVSAPGVLLALAAGLSYATYTVASKALLDAGRTPEDVMAGAFTGGALVLLPLLPLAGLGWLASPGGVALALWLGAVPTALAYTLFARGLRRLGSGETATIVLAEPLTATALGAVVLGERPGALAVLGAALVLGGLLVLAVRPPAGRRARLAVGAEGG